MCSVPGPVADSGGRGWNVIGGWEAKIPHSHTEHGKKMGKFSPLKKKSLSTGGVRLKLWAKREKWGDWERGANETSKYESIKVINETKE